MSWIKNGTNPFADMDIPGLETVDYPYSPDHTWYQVRWPSGTITDIQPDRKDPTNQDKLIVHIFQLHRVVKWEKGFQPIGWKVLPYKADPAWQQAQQSKYAKRYRPCMFDQF